VNSKNIIKTCKIFITFSSHFHHIFITFSSHFHHIFITFSILVGPFNNAIASSITLTDSIVIDGFNYKATIYDSFTETGDGVYTTGFSNSASLALASYYNENKPLTTDASFWGYTVAKGTTTLPELYLWTATADDSASMSSLHLKDTNESGLYDYVVISNRFDSIDGWKSDSNSFPNIKFVEWTKVSAVPVPAAVWLMGTGLFGLMGFSRKRSSQATL